MITALLIAICVLMIWQQIQLDRVIKRVDEKEYARREGKDIPKIKPKMVKQQNNKDEEKKVQTVLDVISKF